MRTLKKKYLLSSLSPILAPFLAFSSILVPVASAAPPDPILGNPVIHQIGFVVKDIDKASTDFAKLFGFKKPATYDMGQFVESSKYRNQDVGFDHKATFFDTESIQVELLQPGNEPSTIGEFLRKSGEGIHHTSIAVTDIENKSKVLVNKGHGTEVVQTGNMINDGGQFSFVDTSYIYKTMLELVEIKTTPPFPPNEPSGTPLLGTRKIAQLGFVVNDLEQAVNEYAQLLGAEKPPVIKEDRAKKVVFNTPTIAIELVEPDNTGNIWRKHLQANGEGVYDLAFEVKNLKESVKLLESMGYPVIYTDVDSKGTKFAYVDTSSTFKVVFKLIEKK